MASLLLKFWGRLLPGKGFGLAAAGSWQRGQVKVELRQATGGLGHAGLGRQQGKKKSIGKVKKKVKKKVQKKVKCAAPGLGGLLETTKSQKKVKKKSKVEKVEKSQKKKSKKSHKKVKKKSNCENPARILALADYWRQQKVKKKSKKSQKKSILTAILGQDRAGHLGLWGGYQGHQGQAWLGAEETLGQWLGLGRGPVTLG